MLRTKLPDLIICKRVYSGFIKIAMAILSVAAFLNPGLKAQESGKRPSIGLALSGGGALGIAHLGVLKVMEESGLRPDYIAGVSMGSIIGAMYSIGYSADSILKILNSIDLNNAIINKIPENKIIFLEKKHFQNSISSFPVTFRKVILPSGLTNGQVIENFLGYYSWPAADINDFSKLPIPYTCIAADILTDSKVDLNKGYLPDAIRASMAIPSVFTPVKIDTALFVDGGIIRNFPGQEVIDMGASIVIGSYTGFQWRDEEQLQSISGILKQISFSRSYKDFESQKKLVRYLVIPGLKGLSSMDFSRVDSIYARGYSAALPFKNRFIMLADSLNKLGAQKPLENILNKEVYTFDLIKITGNSNYSDRQILGVLEFAQGDPVTKDMLRDKIDLLYGNNWFEKIKYRIDPVEDSLILVIECTERPKAISHVAMHYDDATGTGALIDYSVKNFLVPGAIINIDTYIGQYFRVRAFILKYIGRNLKYNLAAGFHSDNTLIPVLHIKKETGNVISRNFTAELSFSRMLGLNHLISISGEIEYLNLLPRYVSPSGLDRISYNNFKTSLNYMVNSLDNKHFPDRGTILNISGSSARLLSGIIRTDLARTVYDSRKPGDFLFDRYFSLNGNFRQYIPSGEKLTISIHTDALLVSKCDSAISGNNFFLLGGIQSVNERSVPMTGFHPFEIPVKKAAGVGIELDFEIFKDIHLTFMSDLFAVQDIYMQKGFSLLSGFGAGAGYMSVIGPLKAGIMYGKNPVNEYFNNFKGYISIGFNF